jgi:hypothetical protein
MIEPWKYGPLDEWAIVGMNHYFVNGKKMLFVAMMKDGRCIKSEGEDDEYLWNRLWHQATTNEATE